MNKEHFKILKEINSLELEIDSLEALNQGEANRIAKLVSIKEQSVLDLVNIKEELNQTKAKAQKNENALVAFDARMKKVASDLKASYDSKEMELLEREKEKIIAGVEAAEDNGLELLDKITELENSAQEKEVFLKGIEETIAEIKEEVESLLEKNRIKIDSLKGRIEFNIQELPPNFQQAHYRVKKKALASTNFSQIQNGRCSYCKMSVDKEKESQVEEKLALKTCSSCSRIFIPHQSLY